MEKFIVAVHDWNTDKVKYVGTFDFVQAAMLWIDAQAKNDNEDIDYEICQLEAP